MNNWSPPPDGCGTYWSGLDDDDPLYCTNVNLCCNCTEPNPDCPYMEDSCISYFSGIAQQNNTNSRFYNQEPFSPSVAADICLTLASWTHENGPEYKSGITTKIAGDDLSSEIGMYWHDYSGQGERLGGKTAWNAALWSAGIKHDNSLLVGVCDGGVCDGGPNNGGNCNTYGESYCDFLFNGQGNDNQDTCEGLGGEWKPGRGDGDCMPRCFLPD